MDMKISELEGRMGGRFSVVGEGWRGLVVGLRDLVLLLLVIGSFC
jgi:hypothetical protein